VGEGGINMAKFHVDQKVYFRDYKNPTWKGGNLSRPLTIAKVELNSEDIYHYWFKECGGWLGERDLISFNLVGCKSNCRDCKGKCALWEKEEGV
jgi:hypothetical protein